MSLGTYKLTAEDAARINSRPARSHHDLAEGDEYPAIVLPRHEFDGGHVEHVHVFLPDGIETLHHVEDNRVGAGIQPGQQVPTQEAIAAYLEKAGLMVVPRGQDKPQEPAQEPAQNSQNGESE